MAETTLTVKELSKTGVASALAAANTDGSKWLASGGRTFLHIKNASGGAITATIEGQQTTNQPGVGPVLAPDMPVVVAATTGDVKVGPISAGYCDSDGFAHVTFSGVTSLTIAAFELPKAAL